MKVNGLGRPVINSTRGKSKGPVILQNRRIIRAQRMSAINNVITIL
jgi:hypothetical protein